jgi:hypothetical protein
MYSPYPVSRRGKLYRILATVHHFIINGMYSSTMFYKTEKYQDVLETGYCVLLLQISGTQPTAGHMKKREGSGYLCDEEIIPSLAVTYPAPGS